MNDTELIQECIKLAEESAEQKDNAYGALIAKDGEVMAESGNARNIDNDVTKHAEILVMQEAQKKLKTNDLSEYTIYSNVEPCAMCAFMMRELKFKKVVFGLYSPVMGGFSKWKILQDKELEKLTPFLERYLK